MKSDRGKQRPGHWTVLFWREEESVTRVRVTSQFARFLARSLVVLLAACVVFIAAAFGRREAVSELARYRAENERLVGSLRALEQRSDQLEHALEDIAVREQRFRVMAGLPLLHDDIYSVGIGGRRGGPEGDEATIAQDDRMPLVFSELHRRADLLATSIEEATMSVEENRERYLAMPVTWPVLSDDAWISSPFSWRRLHPVYGDHRPHLGVDISAPKGSPVVSTGSGIVVFAGWKSGYGRVVDVDHGSGYVSRYAHLARIHTREGTRVKRSDTLGTVGETGVTTGPTLHYEILVNGRQVNPRDHLLIESRR